MPEAYTADEILDLLSEQDILDAIDMGYMYIREEGDEVQACFNKDDDPGCQCSYIILSNEPEEFFEQDLETQARTVIDTIWTLVDDDPDSYEDEMTMYVDIILHR